MTEIYLHFLFAHYRLYGNAPVLQNQQRNDEQTTEMHTLSEEASRANESCLMAVNKLNIFERKLTVQRTTERCVALCEQDALKPSLFECI